MAVRALLSAAIDYAGLFPPAQLDMAGAVSEYASYLDSDDAWALGRFVLPASRLDELAEVALEHSSDHRLLGTPAWRLSAVFGADIAAEMQRVDAFNVAYAADGDGWRASVDAVELRASSLAAVADAMSVVPRNLERFVEIPIANDPTALVRAVGEHQAYAKVRTGGTTVDAFPSSTDLARFLSVCVALRVPFKATAGLHHPLRGDYPLTYAPDSAVGRMYGFLNVILATALLASGIDQADVVRVLEEQDPAAIRFDETGVSWRGHRVAAERLRRSRDLLMQSFGSCSFREPLDDLSALGLL
jgi:hypothetical protein